MTAVAYEAGDFLGYLLAWSSLLPIFVVIAECTAFILAESPRRRRQAGALLLGQLVNELLNIILKRLLRHPRPSGSGRADYGMPSSHAQFAVFALFALCSLLSQAHRPVSQTAAVFGVRESSTRALLKSSIFFSTCSVLYSRIYLGYHDTKQVLVGALVGAAVGLVWTFSYRQAMPKAEAVKAA